MNLNKTQLDQELEQITTELSDPKAITDLKNFQKLSQRHHFLQSIISKLERLESIDRTLEENKKLLSGDSSELISLAEEENRQLVLEKEEIKKQLDKETGKGAQEDRDVIMEIRAGTGGDEAGLFASDLFQMYSKFIAMNSWKMEILNSSLNEVGGIKEIVFEASGSGAYEKLKFESGVHRVQRVPSTEKAGRIHTSTATVAVFPEAEEEEIAISPNDLRIDVFRSSGPGGQSVNTTDSAVRITHFPTGLVVSCQDEKSQLKNKEKGLKILKSRILAKQEEEKRQKEENLRKSMIGSGDRSEKIRTYNFPQDRLTDHRIKQSWHGLEKILEGEIEEIVDELEKAERTEAK
ncbi:MAG: peptide chain release factor 1 [bacterium]